MAIRNLSRSAATTHVIATGGGDAAQVLGLQVSNNSGGALTTFDISVRAGNAATAVWSSIASAAGDFSSPANPLLRTVGTPVSLGNTSTAFILMLVQGIHEVKITASAAVSIEATLG
jgi:hypothetical protein